MKKPWHLPTGLAALTVVVWLTIIYVTAIDSPSPVVLWRDRQTLDDFAATNRILSGVEIDEVSWKDVPFEVALAELEKWIHRSGDEAKAIHFDVAEGVPRQTPINLKFKAVPANEVLRYLTALNQARSDFRYGGLIDVSPFDAVPPELVDGWFSTDSAFFHGVDLTQTDAVRALFRSAGIALPQSNKIEFFPGRDLLKISSNSADLDMIDVFLWSGCEAREPTWRDHLTEWWYQKKIRLRLAPAPLPTTPSSAPLAPDPFGGSPSEGIGSPPDPFGH